MNNQIGNKIRTIRERKEVSQVAIADELNISQSNYGRLEKEDRRLTVPKLKIIAKVLNVSIAFLFDEKNAKIINQQHNESAMAYNVETLIQADKDHIESLRNEIKFLRSIVDKSKTRI